MATQLQIAHPADRQVDPSIDEKIDVATIRLKGSARAVAVLGEFRAADRLLASWLLQARGPRSFDFEVTFIDGCVLCGCYEYRKWSKCRPSLSSFVREAMVQLPAQQGDAADWSRYAVEPF